MKPARQHWAAMFENDALRAEVDRLRAEIERLRSIWPSQLVMEDFARKAALARRPISEEIGERRAQQQQADPDWAFAELAKQALGIETRFRQPFKKL